MERIDRVFEKIAQTMLVLYMIFVFLSWLSYRPAFALTTIDVDGTHAVSKDEVSAIAEKALHSRILYRIDRNNTILYPKEAVLGEIKDKYPRIKNIDLKFNDRHKIGITIDEYTPAMLYCDGYEELKKNSGAQEGTSTHVAPAPQIDTPTCFFADDHGYVFAPAPNYTGYPFMAIISPDAFSSASPLRTYALDEDTFKNIQKFITDLNATGFTTHEIHLLPEHDVRIRTDRPWDLLWSTTKDPAESVKNLSIALDSIKKDQKAEKEMSVLDLRFGNKIFYR